ncbi:hypothetical protein ATL51_0232 [Pseudonocardia alni]|uniref:Uncharacterized protein n=1 Tax=Pseudonocardia alni TaxID=33907 RepID=A0AA44ZSK2_PSEA5|nr:hypothetical protein ATL51_0232 [Pseudonocardia alni]
MTPPWAQEPTPRKQPIGLLPKVLFGATALLALFVVVVGVMAYRGESSSSPRRTTNDAASTTPLECPLPRGENGTAWQNCTEREIAAMSWCGVDITGLTPWRPAVGGTTTFISGYNGGPGASVNFQYSAVSGAAQVVCGSRAVQLSPTDMRALTSPGPPENIPASLR